MDLLAELARLKLDPSLLDGVKKLVSEVQAQDVRLQALTAEGRCKDIKIQKLTLELAHLKRIRFGVKNEALTAVQRSLFEEDTDQDLAAVEAELETPVPETKPRTPRIRAGRQPLPTHLARIEIRHEPEACTCGQCQSALVKVGEDISEQLDIEPARFFVIRHIRPQYACRACEIMTAAPVDPAIIDGGMAAPGLLAWVAASKYLDHLPLYRLEQIAARQDVTLARSTLTEWIGRIGYALQPLADRLAELLRQTPSLHADETPVQQLDPGSGKTKRAYMWAYRSNDLENVPRIVVFDYQTSRSGAHARDFLDEWRGHLMVDDYGGYKESFRQGVTELACLAHCRRKFFDLHAAGGHPVADEALRRIGKLYAVEALAREGDVATRLALRQQESRPKLTSLHDWLIAQRMKTADGSGLARAIDYSLKRWHALIRYVDSGSLPIDNNLVENAIRPITLGRRNWLFTGSERAGRRAAAIQSLLATAKLNDLEPLAWLKETLEKLPSWPYSRIDELLPLRSATAT